VEKPSPGNTGNYNQSGAPASFSDSRRVATAAKRTSGARFFFIRTRNADYVTQLWRISYRRDVTGRCCRRSTIENCVIRIHLIVAHCADAPAMS